MEGSGMELQALFREHVAGVDAESQTLGGDDVEMIDAVTLDDSVASPPGDAAGDVDREGDGGQGGGVNMRRRERKRKRKNKRNKNPDNPSNIADINRFVIDTCKRLKEKKSYLVWNAVGCLGVSALSDLVKEVEAIQRCGGQMTADSKRLRTGGGILWNILKTREPKAYKEIMAKGREFEKQLRRPKSIHQQMKVRNEDRAISQSTSTTTVIPDDDDHNDNEPDLLDVNEPLTATDEQELPSDLVLKTERKPLRERMRVPVSYDDLFEEGEIHD